MLCAQVRVMRESSEMRRVLRIAIVVMSLFIVPAPASKGVWLITISEILNCPRR